MELSKSPFDPALTPQELYQFAHEGNYPRELLANPQLDLLSVENPRLWFEIKHMCLLSIEWKRFDSVARMVFARGREDLFIDVFLDLCRVVEEAMLERDAAQEYLHPSSVEWAGASAYRHIVPNLLLDPCMNEGFWRCHSLAIKTRVQYDSTATNQPGFLYRTTFYAVHHVMSQQYADGIHKMIVAFGKLVEPDKVYHRLQLANDFLEGADAYIPELPAKQERMERSAIRWALHTPTMSSGLFPGMNADGSYPQRILQVYPVKP